jgi:hypothetical protein
MYATNGFEYHRRRERGRAGSRASEADKQDASVRLDSESENRHKGALYVDKMEEGSAKVVNDIATSQLRVIEPGEKG